MPSICNYINPFSSDFHTLADFKRLSCPQKVGIVVITTLLACSIIFSILAIPAFRYLVGRCTPQLGTQTFAQRALRTEPDLVTESPLKRIKYIFICQVGGEQNTFENDLGSGNEMIGRDAIKRFWSQAQEKLKEIDPWLSQRSEVPGKICIKTKTFWLFEHGNASVSTIGVDYDSYAKYLTDDSENRKDSQYGLNATDARILAVFRDYTKDLGRVFNQQIQTVDDFFKHKIL